MSSPCHPSAPSASQVAGSVHNSPTHWNMPVPRVVAPRAATTVSTAWGGAWHQGVGACPGCVSTPRTSQMPGGGQEGASEATQLQVRQLARVEPGHLGEFAVGGFGEAAGDLRLVHGGDVCDAVSVWVAHFVVWAAEHVDQP